MRNSKRFLSLVVAALLTGSAFATSANAAKFTDVDVNNEALNDAVELLTALNVTKGTSDTTFGTEENVTRQQMAAFIYRMMKAGKSVEGGTNTTSFEDLDDPTFYFMVSWANSQGIIKGRSATSFDPKGGITLQDAYTMVVRALGYDDGTLTYPIGYISLAEDLGLDENLPSTLNYTDTLTRGNVAIILANMFYAETAEVEIRYDAKFKVVCPDHLTGCPSDCSHDRQSAVSTGSVPTEYHKTVAEAIFEVEKVSQRVVATPNYSFEGFEKPDEDVEMIVLSKDYVEDYEDYDSDIGSLNTIEFTELGLEGKADDYFLSDIVMFVKENEDGEYKIFGATAQGTKKTVAFEDVEFGRVSGTNVEKYYDGEEKEYKIINGKLTLDGTVTYLFDAPYSFAKDQETDKYNAEFITLDSFDGDMEEEEYFMNYVLVDVDADEAVVGTYDEVAAEWAYDGYLSQVFFGGLGEIDVYDCNGDGKPEYLFVKNFVAGTIDATEDEKLADMDYDVELNAEELIIPTDTAIVEGEFEDEDIVLAYVNKDANYVKVAEVLAGKEASIATLAGDKYFEVSTGEKVLYQDGLAVVANGAANLADTFAQYADEDAVVDFDDEATYYFTAGGKLVYVTGLATAINLNDNYVVVLEDAAYMTTAMVEGKLEKAYYIDIYNDGEVKSVKAKKITEDSSVWDEDLTPETGDAYDFTAYVDKLATAKKDKKDAWYFELVDFSINNDMTALHDRNEAANEFRGTIGEGKVTEFVKKNGTLYSLAAAEKEDESKLRGVYVKDYTQIIIRSLDKDGEEIVTLYGADKLPDIKEGTKFANVSYVLVNNTSSTSYENLAVFYGVAVAKNADGDYVIAEMEPSKGDIADVRVIKAYNTTSTEDGTLRVYDVFNPFKGTIESAIEGAEFDAPEKFVKGNIVGLTTTGKIDDGVAKAGDAFTAGTFYDVDEDFEDYENLGFLYVSEFDETTGYLEVGAKVEKDEDGAEVVSELVDAIFQITDETVVSFADKSEETIKTVEAEILNSTSKSYKQAEEKKNATRVFLCVEVDEDNDDEDTLFYLVKFAMIVRD